MKTLESKFDKIYKSNYAKVHRLCMGYTNGDEMLSADLAQEVFIKIWEHIGTFRNESSVSTWIYRITVNTCLMSLRKKKPVEISNLLNVMESTDDSFQEENKSIQLKQLYNCINTLNSDGKSIILLELEGLPQKEIADVMGISHEAIRVRIHRIKEKLTKCVKK
ncbi:sigma-70 family RNA polymerase sigma factor [uncultured Algibacter sp.]|uniref:RNA polymerase sigma factor n=1 Tax=uncultured Algibacter sp. TaxID=298659 RepID=UPI00260BA86E|nr:sigma-70 family RNA polymerase sigma factor [uncultured Algibacter sp.]